MNTVYPLKTLNQIRSLLIDFRKMNGLTQKKVSERSGVTRQAYTRLEANPASVSMERLFRVFTVLGTEMVLSSGLQILFSMSSPIMEESKQQKDLPARWEKW